MKDSAEQKMGLQSYEATIMRRQMGHLLELHKEFIVIVSSPVNFL